MRARRLAGLALLALATIAGIGHWIAQGVPVALPDVSGGKFACVSYAPFREGQSPFQEGIIIPEWQIDEDFAALASNTRCVRTYAVDQGLDKVPEIAARHGLEVLLGVWIGSQADKNMLQMAKAVELANAHPQTVRAIVVGNEVMLRGELPREKLAETIRWVRQRSQVAVTYADVWEFWMRHKPLLDEVDFATIHILPYWEDEPVGIDAAVAHIMDIYRFVEKQMPGVTLLIGETGWPSAGRQREGAVPGRVNQAAFLRDFVSEVSKQGIDYNLIEAFDQPWKRANEGTVGGHWGLYDVGREAKFPLTGPVEELPGWKLWLTGSLLFGLLPLAWATLRREAPGTAAGWATLVLTGAASGTLLTMQARYVVEMSRMPFEWAAGGALWLLSLGAMLVLATALARAVEEKPDSATSRLVDPVRLLALAFVLAMCLGLVFDPRYRDFPASFALLPAVGLALLALLRGLPEAIGDAEVGLALALVPCAIFIAVREGPHNTQALLWCAASLLLALPVLAARLRDRRAALRLQPSGAGTSGH
ncbi:glycoside hydrolase family protein [Oceanibaculum indicum P24]|uniref:Endo-1,3-beta-glucanase btgC n=2 Tax=Oceanibaculum indicum TaxID=526216 RepID=K2JPG7_9PROT|nr:glycoside hydrolase family protein [Oceanibaculum indicum P24]